MGFNMSSRNSSRERRRVRALKSNLTLKGLFLLFIFPSFAHHPRPRQFLKDDRSISKLKGIFLTAAFFFVCACVCVFFLNTDSASHKGAQPVSFFFFFCLSTLTFSILSSPSIPPGSVAIGIIKN